MTTSFKTFVARGAIGGLVGGFLAALFQWGVTEKPIRAALAVEDALSTSHEAPMFERSTQVVGGMAAALIFGICLGVIFGVVLAQMWHRLPGNSDFGRAIRLSGAGFVALALVPALKYPANPPAVGDPGTIDDRTLAYLTLMAMSVTLVIVAWWVWKRTWNLTPATRFTVTVGAYAIALTIAYLVWPATPDAIQRPAVVGGHLAERIVPASVFWRFRLDSLLGNLIIWTSMGTVFGLLCERATAKAATAERSAGELASTTR